jgi:nucleoside-diphosphate-sugar epimerase
MRAAYPHPFPFGDTRNPHVLFHRIETVGDRTIHVLGSVRDTGASYTGRSNHLAELIELEPDRVRFVHGSILDDSALEAAMEGARTVIHLAALGSVPRSVELPQRTWSVNATGTMRVLEAARGSGKKSLVQRVVAASSSSVYGDQPELPKVETQMPRPLSPYAASKMAVEHLLASYANCYGLSTIGLRYFNVFGPRQSADSQYAAVIPAFAKRLLEGESPMIFGDGQQTRDFTFVSNAVLGTLLAGASPASLKGQAVNIAGGTRVSLLMPLVEKRVRMLGGGDTDFANAP